MSSWPSCQPFVNLMTGLLHHPPSLGGYSDSKGTPSLSTGAAFKWEWYIHILSHPIYTNSHGRGQDHGVRFFPERLQSLVVMSLNPDFVTWFKAMWVMEKEQTHKPGRCQARVASGPYERLPRI